MKIFRYFLGFSFISITLFVLLIRPVLGSAQVDYDNGEYYNEETTMFQYDQEGNVVINRDNYNFMEQGEIFGFNTVPEYDENGNVIGTKKELKVVSAVNNLIDPFLEVGNAITKFFGIVPVSTDDQELYDYIIYEEGHEGQQSHILYDLRDLHENFNGIKTDASVSGAGGGFDFPWLLGITYYYGSEVYYQNYYIGPFKVNTLKMTENELLEYIQEYHPDYLN